MLRISLLAAAVALAVALPTPAADEPGPDAYWVFFGTYTGGKGESKGIYRAKLDAKTGKLSEPEVAAEMGSPSFVNIHPNGKFLYAVGEGGGKEGGPVVAFSLDAKTGKLEKLNEEKSGGAGPCHVSISPDGKHAVVANYSGGSCAIFNVGTDGKLGERQFFQHEGSGPNKGRQEGPHGHCGMFTPDSKTALVADLGLDRVKVFTLDASGKASNDPAKDIVTPPGSGPRHITIARDGKFAYVCGELDSTVNVIKLDLAGKSEVIQSLSTLKEPLKGNSTAECILSPNGRFVYVSNRVGDSIAVFQVNEDRKLTAVGHITGDIKIPRNFNIDPSGKWMLIASQDGHKVGVWEVDVKTGLAKETGNTVKVGAPVCVKFIAAE
jgi:6-phosphogluconolactonase